MVGVCLQTRAMGAVRRRRTMTVQAELVYGLSELGIPFFPSAANFVLLFLGSSAKEVVASLARQGILIRDRCGDFGGQGYVRITFGTLSQTRRVLRRLKEIL